MQKNLRPYDFDWDNNIPKTLTEQCIEAIAKHWSKSNLPVQLPWCSDTCMLLDILPTNVPLELAVSKIEDDIFWKRCYKERWPSVPPRGKNFSDVPTYQHLLSSKDNRRNTVSSTLESRRPSSLEYHEVYQDSEAFQPSRKQSKISVSSIRTLSVDVSSVLSNRSWKQCYLEKHLEEALENLLPEDYDPHKIKELSDLCGNYAKRVILKQLKAPRSDSGPSDYIPLHPILSGLPNLQELSICYKQTYVGEKFCWHMLKTTMTDIKSLSTGLDKCKLTILRVLNSDVDCKKVVLWVKALLKNETLKVLDFSHCKIGDYGILAIGRLLQIHPRLETLIMKNNTIGAKGAEVLAFLLKDPSCKITTLDLRLNEIDTKGGRYISTALIQGVEGLKKLYLASCGMTRKNTEWGKVVVFNKSLEELDISNNRMGEEVGKEISKGMKYNTGLINFDVRMCEMSPDTEILVRDKIFRNRMGTKLKHSEWTQLQLQKAIDFSEIRTDEIVSERDINKEIAQVFV